MKTEFEIKKRIDVLKIEAQRISMQIEELNRKIEESQKSINQTYLRIPFIKEKDSLHISLAIINSRWAELLWILE